MDFLKNAMGKDQSSSGQPTEQGQMAGQKQGGGGGFLSGIGDKFNSAAGGGRESEKNEDYLDKGVCYLSSLQVSISALQIRTIVVTNKSDRPNRY